MSFDAINPDQLPQAGQFSHVVRKGNFVFISGQTAGDDAKRGNLDPLTQADSCFGYLKIAIEEAGGSMDDIVKVNIYLTDGSQFPSIMELRPRYFKKPYPAATTIVVNSMVQRSLVMEIEAIAILDE